MSSEQWRVGEHYGIHVYAGREPVATFHRPEDAARAVDAVNGYRPDDVWAEPAREAVAQELERHQGLRGPMDDTRPDVWQNRCECGWDDGDEHPGWRERYRQHIADELLSLPAVRAWAGEQR